MAETTTEKMTLLSILIGHWVALQCNVFEEVLKGKIILRFPFKFYNGVGVLLGFLSALQLLNNESVLTTYGLAPNVDTDSCTYTCW